MRTSIKPLIVVFLLLITIPPAARPAYAAPLYFPHVVTSAPWQTEIAVVNTSPDQGVAGTLKAFNDEGDLIGSKHVILTDRDRRQIDVAGEFGNHTDIGYIVFDTNSDTVQGYTKIYREGYYRAAIPAIREGNASPYLYVPHIASDTRWWTGISLVNTTSETKDLTILFNNDQHRQITLHAKEHRAFDIMNLFDNQPQPDIHSAIITNAGGVIGLEIFGGTDGKQLEGVLLAEKNTSTLYYPHVAGNEWWTGIVAYNPTESDCTMTITPYDAQGFPLTTSTRSLVGKERYIGTASDLSLPIQTAWFRIDSTLPITGFEFFGSADGSRLAAYAAGGAIGEKEGVFPKIEKDGWTGIAFVNTEDTEANVTLTAYDDTGTAMATRLLTIDGHAKVVDTAESLFPEDIGEATYIAYSSDREVVGLQLNGSSDGTMLDGLPALAGGGPPAPVWQHIAGPEGGEHVQSLAIDPTNSRIIYAGTDGGDYGGIYKTTNGGASWTPINIGLSVEYITSLAIDPANNQVVYAGHSGFHSGGIRKTTNGGASWKYVQIDSRIQYVQCLAINPANSRIVYAGTEGNGVFKTTDGGASWSKTGLTNKSTWSLAIDPADSRVIYAGTGGTLISGTIDDPIPADGVYKTTDGGASWTAINAGLGSKRVISLAIDPADSRIVYAGTYYGVFKTTDGGASWIEITGLPEIGVRSLAIDPEDSRIVYAGTGSGVFKTTDGGVSWIPITGLANSGVHSLAIDPANSQVVYAGGMDGIFKTTDGGASSTAINTGITNYCVYSLAIDPEDSQTVYVGAYGRGVFKTIDGSRSWTVINTGLTNHLMVNSLTIDPADSRIVYAGTGSAGGGGGGGDAVAGGIFKTTDGGASWTAMNTGITNPAHISIRSLAIDPADSRVVYAGTNGNGVFKTIDGGVSWAEINTGITNNAVLSLAIDPIDSRIVYAGTFKTTDGGATWTATGLTGAVVQSLAIDPKNSQTVYAGTNGSGVFKTIDGGGAWTAINTGLPNTYSVRSLAIDPENSQIIYAGSDGGGVFKTANGGVSWTAINDGLTNYRVNFIAIDPENSRIVYAGTGSGIFRRWNK